MILFAILDPLKANQHKLGVIYVNSALVPWTICTVSSCVCEFWSWSYFLSVNTLTLCVPTTLHRGRGGTVRERDEWTHCTYSSFVSVSLRHDRGRLAALLSVPALLHSRSGLLPKSDTSRTYCAEMHWEHLSCFLLLTINHLSGFFKKKLGYTTTDRAEVGNHAAEFVLSGGFSTLSHFIFVFVSLVMQFSEEQPQGRVSTEKLKLFIFLYTCHTQQSRVHQVMLQL